MGISEGFNASVTACESLSSLYKSLESAAKELIQQPKRFMKDLQNLADYPFSRATSVISGLQKQLLDVNLSLTNLLNGVGGIDAMLTDLKALVDCPFLADTAIGKQAAAMIDLITSTAGGKVNQILNTLKTDLVKEAFNAVNDKVNSILNEYKNLIDQSLSSISSKYDELLANTGINAMMKQMKQLESCIGNFCSSYKSVGNFAINDVPKLVDSLAGYITDPVNTAKAITGKATVTVKKMAGEVEKGINDCKDKAEKFTKKYSDLSTSIPKTKAAIGRVGALLDPGD